MKPMILTGLSTEQSFDRPEPSFFLVFNQGELRVPVNAEAAEIVIQTMYSGESPVPEPETPYQSDDEDGLHEDRSESEEEIPQA